MEYSCGAVLKRKVLKSFNIPEYFKSATIYPQ